MWIMANCYKINQDHPNEIKWIERVFYGREIATFSCIWQKVYSLKKVREGFRNALVGIC
jgi:hypothetical protein